MTASAPRIAQVAVGIVAGTVVLAMTACGTAPSVDDAVRSCTAAFLSGNGDKAYDLLSARCQSVLSREQLRRHCCVRGWEQQLPCLVHEIGSLCRPAHPVLGVRQVPVSAGGDHLGGALVSAFRTLLP